jgi:PAS domain S-box-containing protein
MRVPTPCRLPCSGYPQRGHFSELAPLGDGAPGSSAHSGLEAAIGGSGRPPVMTRFSPTSVAPRRPAELQLIAESIPHIVWMAESDGSTEYLNRRGCEYTGFPAGATYGWDWLSLVHPADVDHAQRCWVDATRTGSLFELDCRIRRADGDFRWHSIRSQPLRDAGGQIRDWIATATDIDDQKRLEDHLRQARKGVTEERRQADEFRSVVMANMAEGLFTSDRQGRFTFLNAAAERMLGWSERELRGKPVHATIHFQHPDGSPLANDERELLKLRTKGHAVRVADDAFTRKDGSMFPVAFSATPLVGGTDSSGLVVVFRDTTEEKAEREQAKQELDALTWVGRTRDALNEGRLILYSQPIIPLAGGAPSEELLLRMIGREGEIIRPALFLPAAEKYGLIGEIDQRVVTQAAQLAASGRRVQANLSAQSISSLDLLPLIEHAMREAGANPSDLVFEITETALMEDVEAGEAFARGMTEIGCDLALDDFGTGYGSFTRLKRLPIKYLKIDIEFVRDLVSSPGNRHVVKAITGLARGFGQQTIAEGVEDRETLVLLGDSGVDFAQGYHVGRPAPLTEIEACGTPAPKHSALVAEGGRETA